MIFLLHSLPPLFICYKDLCLSWAKEMAKCNEIMNQMMSCQKTYEEKALAAEKKLEEWKNKNRAQLQAERKKNEDPTKPLIQKQIREDGKEVLCDSTGKALLDDQ